MAATITGHRPWMLQRTRALPNTRCRSQCVDLDPEVGVNQAGDPHLRDPVHSCRLAALPHPLPGQPCRRHRVARPMRDTAHRSRRSARHVQDPQERTAVVRQPRTRREPGIPAPSVPMPLSPETIQRLTAAAKTNPALKLLIALVGIHALYPHQARALPLTAVDYIHLRHQRWPHTRNPHVFISSQTAHTRAPVTTGWMRPLLRGLPVTAQQLREDRILEEAAVTGADPQHCARCSTSLRRPDSATPASSTPTPPTATTCPAATWRHRDRPPRSPARRHRRARR